MASRVLVADRAKSRGREAAAPAPDRAWGAVGVFGALLAAIGLGDIALMWFPLGLGRPEWEFATVAASFSGLPLPTMGLAALLAAAWARGRRRSLRVVAWTLAALALWIVGSYVLFLTDVPLALRSVPPGAASVGVVRAVIKTSMLAVGFTAAYLVLAVAALRHARGG